MTSRGREWAEGAPHRIALVSGTEIDVVDVKYGGPSWTVPGHDSNGRIASLSLRVSERECVEQASAYCRIAYPLWAKSARTIVLLVLSVNFLAYMLLERRS